jgi:hypothetical protein
LVSGAPETSQLCIKKNKQLSLTVGAGLLYLIIDHRMQGVLDHQVRILWDNLNPTKKAGDFWNYTG